LLKPGNVLDDGQLELGAGAPDAVGEVEGTSAWLPCNNALADKASFDFYIK